MDVKCIFPQTVLLISIVFNFSCDLSYSDSVENFRRRNHKLNSMSVVYKAEKRKGECQTSQPSKKIKKCNAGDNQSSGKSTATRKSAHDLTDAVPLLPFQKFFEQAKNRPPPRIALDGDEEPPNSPRTPPLSREPQSHPKQAGAIKTKRGPPAADEHQPKPAAPGKAARRTGADPSSQPAAALGPAGRATPDPPAARERAGPKKQTPALRPAAAAAAAHPFETEYGERPRPGPVAGRPRFRF